ncbi:3-methyladenine DNA glycosylase [Sulfurovum lithotrophicum]|uniref:3-methyladenine DNA glycosylase n=1 Tax=Sulfurovum lithotrophicum TaxID=206403 RepID=A0A7U4M331_9BACT|nr:3-methyladenine DNA glycosylase [Sulfurovum lithotrophicum]
MQESYALYKELESLDLLQHRPKYWWPGAGSFEVIVGAVLTQNTTWKNVERSLQNLEGCLTLENFFKLSEEQLKERIHPSGFYNQKAPRLFDLAKNIKAEFRTFERFQTDVSREWLLKQKGVGPETADSILCYACFRDEMVVDSYTKRVLREHDIVLPNYTAYKTFLEKGIREQCHEEDLNLIFARFHGMIVEYNKKMKLKA